MMRFVKAECGGNDFIIIEKKELPPKIILPRLVKIVTERYKGIGGDGVVVIDNSSKIPFLQYFNKDGSEFSVCGNGGLCVLVYRGKGKYRFKTKIGIIEGEYKNGKAKIALKGMVEGRLCFTIKIGEESLQLDWIDIGVPHAVVYTNEIEDKSFTQLAPKIRHSPEFGKDGVNVNFVQIIRKDKIKIRTFERGVEGETLSCGSGSCGSVLVGWIKGKLNREVEVETKGGKYKVYIEDIDRVWLEGTPTIVYKGEINIRGNNERISSI
jgi:diaminopimelate epimerase